MKKILLYAVLLLAAIGCQKSTLELEDDPSSSENLISITIQAELPNNTSDTRISTIPGEWDEVWESTWEADDVLTLVPTEGTTLYTLKITEIVDGIATFTGDVAEGTYEVYCVDAYTYDSGNKTFAVDYSEQEASDNCSGKPMMASETITVAKDESTDFSDLIFGHISQTVELRLSFEGVAETDSYTLDYIEISDTDGVVDAYYGFEKAALSFTDKVISSTDNSFSAYCYLPPFTIGTDESITLTAYLTKSGEKYITTYTVTNSSGSDVVFEAGNHNYLTATFSNLSAAYWKDYAATSFVEGEYVDGGTSYTIKTSEQLAYLSNLVNAGTTMSDVTFTLANDIDLSGKEFTTIGTSNSITFKGTFDGGGYTVKGLYIYQPSSDYQGLFGFISGATIKNASVSGEVTGKCNVGGLVGYSISSSSIINCYNAAVVEGTLYVGGIMGCSSSASVTNCYNSASVKGSYYVGGVVGESSKISTVTNCYNTATIEGTKSGGIGGSSYSSTVTNCYWLTGVASNGIGYDYDNESASDAGTTAMSDTDMKDYSFRITLNNNAHIYNLDSPTVEACAWAAVEDDYPILDFDYTPGYSSVAFAKGSGSKDDPYLIETADDLRQLSLNVNLGGNSYPSKYLEMTKDIDLGGIDSDGKGVAANEFTAIGYFKYGNTNNFSFTGTFDGGGFEVSGLYIDQSETNSQGLFGYISGATITNLTVSGSVTGKDYVGGIVGYSDAYSIPSTITSCTNNATIKSSGSNVGGIVGDATLINITSCTNTATVTSNSSAVGGVAGYIINPSSTVTNCYNSGNVSGTSAIGGVVGSTASTVTNCYNSGEVLSSNSESSSTTVGGVVGSASTSSSTVTNCYNSGKVSISDNISSSIYVYLGGVVGSAANSSATVTNCYNSGELSIVNTTNLLYLGGVAGYSSGTVTNCYWLSSENASNGIGRDGTTREASDVGTTEMSDIEMQAASFVILLTNGAYTYNLTTPSTNACAWSASSTYPALDFTNLNPEYKQISDVTGGTGL